MNSFMIKKIINIAFTLSILASISCSTQGPIFEKYKKFDNSSWDRFNKIIFNVPITEPNADYDITFVFKPNKEFSYGSMPVYVIMDTPSGEERMNDVKLTVKSEGKFVGATEGQPIVIKSVLWKSLNIAAKGNLKISFENMVPKIQTSGINEIGIIVEKSAKE